ncbi:MAG: hypothetical protein IT385_14865 [Deltaproteobacteria bacterium]|nr:hypothetical protein [Deltaproteobacteria bacterium]
MPSDRHEALYASYLEELERELPRLVILPKGRSRLCRVIDRALRIVTFGGMRTFLTGFVTTLGQRIYVPDDWERVPPGQRYCTLRHEIVHVRQFRRFTFPGMVVLYLLLPLPVGFSPGRAWLEWQAYKETLAAHWQVHGPAYAKSNAMAEHIVARFVGPEYAWMWVSGRHVRSWIARELARLEGHPPPALEA